MQITQRDDFVQTLQYFLIAPYGNYTLLLLRLWALEFSVVIRRKRYEDSCHLQCLSVPADTYCQYIAAYQAFLTAN